MAPTAVDFAEPASAINRASVAAAGSPSRALRIGVPQTIDSVTAAVAGQTPTKHPQSVVLHSDQPHHRPSQSTPISRRLSPLDSYAQRQIQPTAVASPAGHTAKAASATDVQLELQTLYPAPVTANGEFACSFPPLELRPSISVDDDPAFTSSCWFYRYRLRRNLTRVTFAGALSTLGALLAGFDPSFWGILVGGGKNSTHARDTRASAREA